MSRFERPLTGVERTFEPHEIIVSKTDLYGKITYANTVFCRVAQYREDELLNKPHSIVRHPEMPRCVFQVLWDTLKADREIFAYVLNRAKSGDHYWVFAHVTPTRDVRGNRTGYHSSRRVPNRESLRVVEGLYRELREVESRHRDPREATAAGVVALLAKLKTLHTTYDELIFSMDTEAAAA